MLHVRNSCILRTEVDDDRRMSEVLHEVRTGTLARTLQHGQCFACETMRGPHMRPRTDCYILLASTHKRSPLWKDTHLSVMDHEVVDSFTMRANGEGCHLSATIDRIALHEVDTRSRVSVRAVKYIPRG